LANKIKAGTVKKINNGSMPFIQMENINAFLVACKSIGVPDTDLFMTVDLFEAKNMGQVIQTLHALGRHSQKVSTFGGPYIGTKLATANPREFTEEQLRQGESVIPLQTAGSHGNANASGQFDSSREIVKGPGRRF
jgi:transgelin